MNKKFYKTKISFFVLSEEPIPPDTSLSAIIEESVRGEYVMSDHISKEIELTPKKMADELFKVGAEPEFFGIDDSGNQIR